MLDHLNNHQVSVPMPGHLGGASDAGDFGYSVGVDLPDALHKPSVSMSYSSSSSGDGWLGRGWSLNSGVSIHRLSRRETASNYVDQPGVVRISGGGLSGLLEPTGDFVFQLEQYEVVAPGPGVASAEFDPDTSTWTVYAGGVKSTLIPRVQGSPNPRSWHITRSVDASGNQIDWTYEGHRLDKIVYGGNASFGPSSEDEEEGGLYPPTARVLFHYEDLEHPAQFRRSYSEGVGELVEQQLSQIEVQTRKVTA